MQRRHVYAFIQTHNVNVVVFTKKRQKVFRVLSEKIDETFYFRNTQKNLIDAFNDHLSDSEINSVGVIKNLNVEIVYCNYTGHNVDFDINTDDDLIEHIMLDDVVIDRGSRLFNDLKYCIDDNANPFYEYFEDFGSPEEFDDYEM